VAAEDRLGGGDRDAGMAEPQGGFGPKGVQLKAVADRNSYRLSGTKRHVAFAQCGHSFAGAGTHWRSGPGHRPAAGRPKAPGVELTQQRSLASDTQYQVVFKDVRVPLADRVASAQPGWATWHEAMYDGIILLAAQAMGGAQRALEMTVQYAKEREQFDKPLGAFQAIAHYLADASTAIDGGTPSLRGGLGACARQAGQPAGAHGKAVRVPDLPRRHRAFQQIYGGMGFTIECDIQLYFRRAKQLQMTWWDSRYLEELVASDVLMVERGQQWSLTGI